MIARTIGVALLSAATLFTVACATQEDGLVTAGTGRPASGTAGDSRNACMDRIPSDASSGQRMLAEASCERDHAGKQSILAVPDNK